MLFPDITEAFQRDRSLVTATFDKPGLPNDKRATVRLREDNKLGALDSDQKICKHWSYTPKNCKDLSGACRAWRVSHQN